MFVSDITHLIIVYEALKKYYFESTNYDILGLQLGLYQPTINVIEGNNKGDADKCLRKVLEKWLSCEDGVNSRGDPTWHTLIIKLKSINKKVSEGIDYDRKLPKLKLIELILLYI